MAWLVGFAAIASALWASGHVLLHRRDPRAALWWFAVAWCLPFLGPLLYYLFGINRLERNLRKFRMRHYVEFATGIPKRFFSRHGDKNGVDAISRHLIPLATVGDQVLKKPLLQGNSVLPLRNGDAAYPVMLRAIREARKSISLSSYIFKWDEIGKTFVEALGDARQRGVEIRVLIDDLGSSASLSKVGKALQERGIAVASFNPPLSVTNLPYMNLRNHRKLMVVDGQIGFCGGMNIHQENLIKQKPENPVHDFHFKLEGPVVAQIQEGFAEDWLFCTKEELRREIWFPTLEKRGPTFCRGIADGPDEGLERLRWILQGAINAAQRSITIVSPYFIPDQALVNALNVAALRGVEVNVILPATSDWPLVMWASTSFVRQVVEHGCRVWYAPPPFDHSKLMIVDEEWTLFGSSNWDTRSLRLNFEFNIECYDRALAQKLKRLVEQRIKPAKSITLRDLEERSLPVKLRDGVARLFAPHL